MNRVVIVAAALIVAVVAFLVLRPGGGDDDATPTTTQPTTTTATTEPSEPSVPPPPRPSPPRPAVVRITVRDGTPVGGVRRLTVAEGRRVTLVVTSNVADRVHLHGYNVFRDVAPGRPARIAFRATIVGTVEAELEDGRVPLARITAQP